MPETIHILASCRNIELLPATLMVFRTLRVGFPTADVLVHTNVMHPAARRAVEGAAKASGCAITSPNIVGSLRHDEWIEKVFHNSHEPFWICDTDIAFFSNCEQWSLSGNFAGRLTPAFVDEWTNTVHEERLHTCLQWFNPKVAKIAMWEWCCRLPESPAIPQLEFFRQAYWPRRGEKTRFHDSTSGLWNTIGGTPFTQQQNQCFEHLNCGTYSDLIGPYLKGVPDFQQKCAAAAANPQILLGAHVSQAEYYESRKP